MYSVVMSRFRKWRVSVKSGISFEREMRIRRRGTLGGARRVSLSFWVRWVFGYRGGSEEEVGGIYPRKLSSIQHSPSVHPTVVSPRRLRQLNTRSSENGLPAASVVNSIKTVPKA